MTLGTWVKPPRGDAVEAVELHVALDLFEALGDVFHAAIILRQKDEKMRHAVDCPGGVSGVTLVALPLSNNRYLASVSL